MRQQHLTVLAGVLALTITFSGCGGEEARAPVPAAPQAVTVDEPVGTASVGDPERAAYIRKADRICAELDPKRDAKRQQAGDADDPEAAYGESVDLAAEQLRRIDALTPPAGDGDLIASNVIDRLQARLDLRRRLQTALADGDEGSAARDQAQLEALGTAVRSFARGYGFKECGAR